MKAIRIILVIVVVLIIAVVVTAVLPIARATQPTESTPFDHSQCQYPYRTTNPVDGCDNTDPCDPAQTKGGSGDCLPVQEPTTTPVETLAPAKNQCEGQ